MINIDQKTLDEIRKTLPKRMAEEICSVQPIPNIDWNDPLLNTVLNNFFERHRKQNDTVG